MDDRLKRSSEDLNASMITDTRERSTVQLQIEKRRLEEQINALLANGVNGPVQTANAAGAKVFGVLDPPASAGRIALCVQYALKDQAAFDDYLRDHAPRLRADGMARFGDRFQASRRMLPPTRR